MNKQQVWDFLARIPRAQDFVKEVSAQFPVQTIMANNKGDVVVYRQSESQIKPSAGAGE